jgi:aminoglycoside phosphotransferase (APT) family kinase protein
VETLLWDPGILCVVTREAEGVPLDRLTGRDARWPSSEPKLQGLERAMTRIGRWLARFQQLPAAGQAATVNLDDTREYIDARLRRLTAMPGAGFDERDRAAVLDYVDRRAGEVAAADLGEVAVHGDITPSNVVAGPESVTVLDFGMTARGSRYFDLSRLYTQLEFYTAKPQYRPAAMSRLQNAAIAGFAPGLHADHPLFAIYAVQHVVCHYVSHARQPGAFPASLYSAHQCRRHRQWLRELARRPGTATPAAGGAAASAR